MSRNLVRYFYRDGDEPPACTRGNDGTHDLAMKAERFGHVDGSKLGDAYSTPINSKFIVGKIETQSVPFLAFQARKPALFTILTRMFEFRKCSFLLHAPVVVKGLPKMAKFLFWSAFGDLVAPRELFAFDPVVFYLEVFHLGPFSLHSVVFPASQCPIVGMAGHTASFAEVDFLFWCGIEPNHMR